MHFTINSSYLSETGEKLLRIRVDNTCGKFFKHLAYEMILKLGTELTVAEIFDRIKKETEKIEQSIHNLYLALNLVKVWNEEKLLLKQLMYTQDVVIHFKTVIKKQKCIFFFQMFTLTICK